MTTLTLTATQLRDLVTPVIPHASKDDTLPSLTSVRIRTAGHYVTAIATDRYRIGFQRLLLEEQPPEGFDALVPVRVLKRMLTLFRPTRWHNPTLSLTVDQLRMTVASADALTDDGMLDASLTFGLAEEGVSPRNVLDRLVAEALAGKPDGEAMVPAFNPHFLADFRLGQPQHIPMRISATGKVNKPWLVRIGEDFIGLIVPVRQTDGVEAADVDSWLPLLSVPAEEPKAA